MILWVKYLIEDIFHIKLTRDYMDATKLYAITFVLYNLVNFVVVAAVWVFKFECIFVNAIWEICVNQANSLFFAST